MGRHTPRRSRDRSPPVESWRSLLSSVRRRSATSDRMDSEMRCSATATRGGGRLGEGGCPDRSPFMDSICFIDRPIRVDSQKRG